VEHLATLRLDTGDTLEVYRDDETPDWGTLIGKLTREDARFVELTTGRGQQLVNVEHVLHGWPAGDRKR
jgi:hypothetical protein